MRSSWAFWLAFCSALPALAIDHSNLDEGRPLRLEDPYPVAHGEFSLEAGLGGTFERRAPNRGLARVELLYGALPNLQLEVGSTFSTNPHEVEEPLRSGDLVLAALYNLNQETLGLPAIGLKVEADLPSGVDSAGTDVELKALILKSVGNLSFHLNAGYTILGGESRGERGGLYEVVLGASYPLGAPTSTRLTLIMDAFTEQSIEQGEKAASGLETGLRYQLSSQVVLDAGVGSEIAGPDQRSLFYFTSGLSISF